VSRAFIKETDDRPEELEHLAAAAAALCEALCESKRSLYAVRSVGEEDED
jgi:hypothetical protein